MDEVMADKVSLSPNLISYARFSTTQKNAKDTSLTLTDTVSFSFTMGTTPIDKSSLNVFTAFRYRVRYASQTPSEDTFAT